VLIVFDNDNDNEVYFMLATGASWQSGRRRPAERPGIRYGQSSEMSQCAYNPFSRFLPRARDAL